MPRHEILENLTLTPEQHAEIEAHGVMKILGTIVDEFENFRTALESSIRIESEHERFEKLHDSIHSGRSVERVVDEIMTLRNTIRNDLEGIPLFDDTVEYRRRTIMRLFDILDLRVRELRARTKKPAGWVESNFFEFRHNFELYFEVLNDCSDCRFRVDFSEAETRTDNYRMLLTLSSLDDDTMRIPIRLGDITRDLAENARTYSPPGSRIDIRIEEGNDAIGLIVSDAGIGIPEDEITRVVGYGVRGSNACGNTHGSGIGLTKAYSLIREWEGRMWIESSPHGTTIEASIPRRDRHI